MRAYHICLKRKIMQRCTYAILLLCVAVAHHVFSGDMYPSEYDQLSPAAQLMYQYVHKQIDMHTCIDRYLDILRNQVHMHPEDSIVEVHLGRPGNVVVCDLHTCTQTSYPQTYIYVDTSVYESQRPLLRLHYCLDVLHDIDRACARSQHLNAVKRAYKLYPNNPCDMNRHALQRLAQHTGRYVSDKLARHYLHSADEVAHAPACIQRDIDADLWFARTTSIPQVHLWKKHEDIQSIMASPPASPMRDKLPQLQYQCDALKNAIASYSSNT